MQGFTLWITGLSGSGKTTLSGLVAGELSTRGLAVETLDGEEVRKQQPAGLGFSKYDRDRHVRALGSRAQLLKRDGGCVIVAAISPYRAVRAEVRQAIGNFCEVYCECPIEVLSARDPRGLYQRALRGEIKNFSGVSDPYEPPEAPEIHLRTDRETPEESLRAIIAGLERLGYIAGGSGG